MGEGREYDKILIATGARAFVPKPFQNLKNAFCMRTVEDATRLREALALRTYKNAVVVGASWWESRWRSCSIRKEYMYSGRHGTPYICAGRIS